MTSLDAQGSRGASGVILFVLHQMYKDRRTQQRTLRALINEAVTALHAFDELAPQLRSLCQTLTELERDRSRLSERLGDIRRGFVVYPPDFSLAEILPILNPEQASSAVKYFDK